MSAISEIKKLTNVQMKIENDLKAICQRIYRLDLINSNHVMEMEDRRELEEEALKDTIANIRNPLQVKIHLIEQNNFHKINDFKTFKREMLFLQDSIRNLKNDSSTELEQLEDEEKCLTEEMTLYEMKLEDWVEPLKSHDINYIGVQPKPSTNPKHFNKQVQEFLDFVQKSGGPENGWKQEDHQLFLKLRLKSLQQKSPEDFIKQVHRFLPDITENEIRLHEEWYKKFTILNQKKKEAIKQWQENKLKSQSTPVISILKKPTVKPMVEVEIKEKLRDWKARKEEQSRNERKLELLNSEKQRHLEELKKKRNQQLKEIVHKWRSLKSKNHLEHKLEMQIAEDLDRKRRAREANRMIKYYRSQDDLFVSRNKKTKNEPDTKTVRSKSCPLGKRDPKRLLKPTKQWMNRIKEENETVQFNTRVNFINCIPKLNVPVWIKNTK